MSTTSHWIASRICASRDVHTKFSWSPFSFSFVASFEWELSLSTRAVTRKDIPSVVVGKSLFSPLCPERTSRWPSLWGFGRRAYFPWNRFVFGARREILPRAENFCNNEPRKCTAELVRTAAGCEAKQRKGVCSTNSALFDLASNIIGEARSKGSINALKTFLYIYTAPLERLSFPRASGRNLSTPKVMYHPCESGDAIRTARHPAVAGSTFSPTVGAIIHWNYRGALPEFMRLDSSICVRLRALLRRKKTRICWKSGVMEASCAVPSVLRETALPLFGEDLLFGGLGTCVF